MNRNPDRSRNRADATSAQLSTRKTTWHPLSLQQLQPREFVDVVNRILDGRNELFAGTLKGASALNDSESRPTLATGRVVNF